MTHVERPDSAASAELRSINHLFERQYVIALEHRTHDAMLLKSDAIDEVAYNLVTATGRNYLHTCAQEIRQTVAEAT